MTQEQQPTPPIPPEAYLTDEQIEQQWERCTADGLVGATTDVSQYIARAATEKAWHSRDAEFTAAKDGVVEVARRETLVRMELKAVSDALKDSEATVARLVEALEVVQERLQRMSDPTPWNILLDIDKGQTLGMFIIDAIASAKGETSTKPDHSVTAKDGTVYRNIGDYIDSN